MYNTDQGVHADGVGVCVIYTAAIKCLYRAVQGRTPSPRPVRARSDNTLTHTHSRFTSCSSVLLLVIET